MPVKYNNLIVAGRDSFVYSGINSPNDSIGSDGDAYVQYDDGTLVPTAVTYSFGTIEPIADVQNYITSATVNYTIVPTYHYAFASNQQGTPENCSQVVTFEQNANDDSVTRNGAFADAIHSDVVINWSLTQLGTPVPTITITNTDVSGISSVALTAARNSMVQGDTVWSCDLEASIATIEGSNLVFAQSFDGDVTLTVTADNASDTKTIHIVCDGPVTATTYVLSTISPIADQAYSATSANCEYTVIPVYHFAFKPTQTGLAVKRTHAVSFTENTGETFVIRDGSFIDSDNVSVNWSLVQKGLPEIVITNTDVSGVSSVELTATRNNAVEGEIVWASSLPADTARIDGNNLVLIKAYNGSVTLVATADNASDAKPINIVCEDPITATTYALGSISTIDDQICSATSATCEYIVIPTYHTSSTTTTGDAINCSRTISFDENIGTENITQSGFFSDTTYSGIVVNWSLIHKGVPSLVITNTDVTDVTVLALTATRNSSVEGDTVWACSLPVETAVIDGTQIDGVNLVFLKPYDGNITLTATADNASDTKTIHVTCTDVVTATTYALGTVTPTEDQEYSATSADIQYTIVPTYYFATKPSTTGTPIDCTQSVIFSMNTGDTTVVRSGSFTNPKYTDITVNWSLNHLGVPVIIITNTGATDTTVLTLTYSANTFVKGDVNWSCNLDSNTVKINGDKLTFLKHYEGEMTLTVVTDNANATKTIDVLCDETPTATTYTLGTVNPIEDAAYSAVNATVEYIIIPVYHYETKPDTEGISILRTKEVSFAENTGYTTIERTGTFDDADYSGITVDWSLNQLGTPLINITNTDVSNVSEIVLTATRSAAVEGDIVWTCNLPADTVRIDGDNLVFLKAYSGSVTLTATADNASATKKINVVCTAPVTATTYTLGTVKSIADQEYSATSANCEYTIIPVYYTSASTITGNAINHENTVTFEENTGDTTVLRSGSFTDADYTSVSVNWSLNQLSKPSLVITNTDVSDVSVIELTATRTTAVEGDIVWSCDLSDETAKIEGSNLVFLKTYSGNVTLSAATDNASATKTISVTCNESVTATTYLLGTVSAIADQAYSATSANCEYTVIPVYDTTTTSITGIQISCSNTVTFEENTGDTVVTRSGSFTNIEYKTVTVDWSLKQNAKPVLTITNNDTTDTAVLALTYTANSFVEGTVVWSSNLPVTTAKIEGSTLTFLSHYEGEMILTATADNAVANKTISVTCDEPVTSTTYVLGTISPIDDAVWSATSAICEYTVIPVYHYASRPNSSGNSINRSKTVTFAENTGDTTITRSGSFTDTDYNTVTVNWSLLHKVEPNIIITVGDNINASVVELTANRNDSVEGDIVWSCDLPADVAKIEGNNLIFLKDYSGSVTLTATADNATATKSAYVVCIAPVTATTYALDTVSTIADQAYSATSATCEYTVIPTYYTSASTTTGKAISRSNTVTFEENTSDTTVVRLGSFTDTDYNTITVNWSLNQLCQPVLTITNTDVSGVSVIELTAIRNSAVEGGIVWTCDLSANTAKIEDNVLMFLKHYEGTVTLTATADNASDTKTINVMCDEPVTAVTYELSAISSIDDVIYSATSAVVNYTVIPTYYYSSKPSETGSVISCSQTVTFAENTDEATIVRSGSFTDAKNIKVDWRLNQLGIPVLTITNTGTTDTAALTLTYSANSNVTGSIVWSCNLDNSTVSIVNNTLTFLKHYEGEMTLTATADNAVANKTISVTCDEPVTATTYMLGTISPIDDAVWSATSATCEYTVIPVEHYNSKPSVTGDAITRSQSLSFEQNTTVENIIRSGSFTDTDYNTVIVNWSLNHLSKPELVITNTDVSDASIIKLTATRSTAVEGDIVWSCDLSDETAKIEGSNLVFLNAYSGNVTLSAATDNASDTKTINVTCTAPVTSTTYTLGEVLPIEDQVYSATSATCEYTIVPTYHTSATTIAGTSLGYSKNVTFATNTGSETVIRSGSFTDTEHTSITINWSLNQLSKPELTITNTDVSGVSVIELTATRSAAVEGDIVWACDLSDEIVRIEGSNLVFLNTYSGNVTLSATTDNASDTKTINVVSDEPVTSTTYALGTVDTIDDQLYSATSTVVKYTVIPTYYYVSKASETGVAIPCSQTIVFEENTGNTVIVRSGSFTDSKNITVDWSFNHLTYPAIITITTEDSTDTAVVALTADTTRTVVGSIVWTSSLPTDIAKIEGNTLTFLKHYEGEMTLTATADNATATKTINVVCNEPVTSITYALGTINPIDDAVWSATSATCEYTVIPVYHYDSKPDTTGNAITRSQTVTFVQNTGDTNVIRSGVFTDADSITVNWALLHKAVPSLIITVGDSSGASVIELTAIKSESIDEEIEWSCNLPLDVAIIKNGELIFLQPYDGEVILTATANGVSVQKTINAVCTAPVTATTYALGGVSAIADQVYSATSATCKYTVIPTYKTSASTTTGKAINRSNTVTFEENTGDTTVSRSGSFIDTDYNTITVNWSLNQLIKPVLVITNTDVSGVSVIELTATRSATVEGDIVWTCDLPSGTARIEGSNFVLIKSYSGPVTLTATADNASNTKTINIASDEPVTATTYALGGVSAIADQVYSATSAVIKYTVIPTYYYVSKASETGVAIPCSQTVTFEENTGDTTVTRSGSFVDTKNITVNWSLKHFGMPILTITNTGATDTTVLVLTYSANSFVEGSVEWQSNLDTSLVKIEDDQLTFLNHYEGDMELIARADNASARKTIPVVCDEQPTATTYTLGEVLPIADQECSATSATCEYTVIPVYSYERRPTVTGDPISRSHIVEFEENTGYTRVTRSGSFTDDDYSEVIVTWSLTQKNDGLTTFIYNDGTIVRKDLTYISWTDLSASTLTECIMGENVKTVGDNSFSGCTKLSSITFGENVSSIGSYAFAKCSSLTDMVIPDSVTSIDYDAYVNCTNLSSVTIGNSVETIGNYAFSGCSNISSITIPNSTQTVGLGVFGRCSKLTDVVVGSGVTSWASGQWADDDTVFYSCPLTSVTLNDGLTTIFSSMFYKQNSIQEIDIPSSVTTIGSSAFEFCSSLSSVTIPDGVTTIGNYAFEGCSNLPSVIIPDGVTTINYALFSGCTNLAVVTIPNGTISIGQNAFASCSSLSSVTIPDSVTTVQTRAFANCTQLTDVTIGSGITSWNSGSSLTDEYIFYGCSSLTSATINEGLTQIFGRMFSGCSGLVEVSLPSSVTTIGSSAFASCSSLSRVTIPSDVTTIGGNAFGGCSSLPSITIPDGVTTIGYNAFSGCSSFTNITIPDSVTTVQTRAFANCTQLTDVTIGSGITSWNSGSSLTDEYIFYGCSSLTSATINEGLTQILYKMFWGCSSLVEVSIPSSVTTIGSSAFAYCSSLSSVTIPSGVTTIGVYAFENCSSLPSITIPDGVTTIGEQTFSGCSSMTAATIGSGVTSIGQYAFSNCAISKFSYTSTKSKWGSITFGQQWHYGCPATYVQCTNGQVALT